MPDLLKALQKVSPLLAALRASMWRILVDCSGCDASLRWNEGFGLRHSPSLVMSC